MGSDKLWLDLGGQPLIGHTLAAAAAAQLFDLVVVATPERNWEGVRSLAGGAGLGAATVLVAGGERRQDSVRNALAACTEATVIAVHDAARPLCPPALFSAVVAAARSHGAATAALPLVDSVKRVDAQARVCASLDRAGLVAVQTPQAFDAVLLRRAHQRALDDGVVADDDCALVEHLGAPVVTVAGDPRNVKVTGPADLMIAAALLEAS